MDCWKHMRGYLMLLFCQSVYSKSFEKCYSLEEFVVHQNPRNQHHFVSKKKNQMNPQYVSDKMRNKPSKCILVALRIRIIVIIFKFFKFIVKWKRYVLNISYWSVLCTIPWCDAVFLLFVLTSEICFSYHTNQYDYT